MKQLRDRKAIVEGNDIVAASPDGQMGQIHTVSAVPKGKGKAVPFPPNFRQDNEDYIDYWKAHHAPVSPLVISTQDWQQLHHDWETFEATTTGVKRLVEYQFQRGNPYLLGERSHNHVMHGGSTQGHSFSEVGSYFQALSLSFQCISLLFRAF